tara:strand:+ start:223 stop:1275 length:1053 start_codon:yes stop_codon:yes gene_type:complete
MKKWKLLVAIVLTAATIIVYITITNTLSVSNTSIDASSERSSYALDSAKVDPSGIHSSISSLASDHETFESELIAKLQTAYGESIQALNVQANLINVKQYVLKYDPIDGNERFIRIIRAAFPEYAASILDIIARLEIYNEWIIENQIVLNELSEQMQQGTIWEKRRELFGADAELIWSDELAELSQKQTKMHDVFSQLDQATSMTIEETLYQLRTAISENHEGSAQELFANGGKLARALFDLESVQQTLKSLPEEERQVKINQVRRELGYSEEQILKLQERDAKRNKKWDNGLQYMSERTILLETTSTADLPAALRVLREKYFEEDAITIEKEEESDFWRFKRPRKYGIN